MVNSEHSLNAKLLYGLLLNRTTLSQKNDWVSEEGNVYVIYTIRQMANDLNRSERTVKTALNELESAGLLVRRRQGWNQANKLFLQLPDRVQLSSPPAGKNHPMDGQVSSPPAGKNCPMDGQVSSPCMGQNLPTSNTDTEYTDRSKKRGAGTRRCFGEFDNVFLSEDEYSALQTDFPKQCGDYIDRLSRYMAANDRHYANHYAVLRKWLDEDSRGRAAKTYTYEEDEGDCL